eukprot:224736_1
MGKCVSISLSPSHGRAVSLSERDPELGERITNGVDLGHGPTEQKAQSIKYTDASHIYNQHDPGNAAYSQINNTKNIEKYLKIEHRHNLKVKKCLLLGAGSSGKSTLFRQLKCIHGPGFDPSEFIESKNLIRSNCVLGILTLLKKSQELYDSNKQRNKDCFIDLSNDQETVDTIHHVLRYAVETFEEEEKINDGLAALGQSISTLWSLQQIQRTYGKRHNYSIIENMDYFLNKASVIFSPAFEPNQEDHLKCRIRTTGLIEANYMINDVRFHIFDVGGQRNERKKWIQLFEGVTAVIFVAALNHYCAVLFEDEGKNAMLESLQLFEEIANSKWFKKTEMILFLNKDDLFKERIRQGIPLSVFFNSEMYKPLKHEYYEEYNGPQYVPNPDDQEADSASLEEAHVASAYFIQSQYERRNHTPFKRIFVHITTATDQENIQRVFWDVQNIVINSNLRKGG